MALHEKFSDDVVVNILAWLPPKEVARMRAVCKRWHALTSEHHFLYTSFLRNSSHSTAAGLFLSDERHRRFSYIPLRHGMTDGHPTPDLSFIPSTPAIDKGQIYVTSSCNGLLICCRPNFLVQYKPRCYLCNPVTKSFIDIDVPDGISRHLSLAYEPSKSQNYRIVALGVTSRDIHMYSSQTRSWRRVACYDRSNYPFAGLRCSVSVFWNGSLVWMVSQHLIRFVMDEEQVVEMPMPRTPEGWTCSYLGESGGHLQMIGFTQEERLTGFLDVLESGDAGGLLRVVGLVPCRSQEGQGTASGHSKDQLGVSMARAACPWRQRQVDRVPGSFAGVRCPRNREKRAERGFALQHTGESYVLRHGRPDDLDGPRRCFAAPA